MKLISIAYTLATTGSLVAASPHHRHHHGHVLKRQPNVEVVTLNEYVVNGQRVSLEEACAGIASGDWRLSDGSTNLTECQTPSQDKNGQAAKAESSVPEIVSKPASSEAPPTEASSTAVSIVASTVTPKVVKFTATPSKQPQTSSSSVSEAPKETKAPASYSYQPKGAGLERDFPSNTIDCSTFPSEYGPISIDWMELGGWSGIQYITEAGGVITDVVTAIKGDRCKSGAMCSYACPPGWQKTQWPTVPPAQGRSVGGLFCNAQNKLELTNPTLSKSLCMKGTGATRVENKLNKDAVICRTDYPGTESQTVPLRTRPGTISELTCPDSNRYYQHDGAATTAQYYINNQGVPKEDACQWNKDGSNMGNWAPSVLGAGRDIYGKTWLSVFTTIDNLPTNYRPLDYGVEIVPEGNGQLSGKCCLKNGAYCFTDLSGATTCNERGCTVQIITGTAKFVLTDN